MKRTLISLCIPFLVCVFAFNSYADEVTIENEGGTYTGEASNGVPNGQGTLAFSNGDLYVGEFKNGKQHGQGTYTFADGSTYVGEYKDAEEWQGTEYDKDGNVTATYSKGVKTEK